MTRSIQAVLAAILLPCLLLPAAEGRISDEFQGFSQAELDQLLAPVALYPDTVLSHVLIAATYPLEVVQAARWTRGHPDLRGEVAVNAVIDYQWDPSVMALVAFPELLERMDADLDWTQMLGDAFLVQEDQVLDSIQRLRGQAHRAGHLGSSEQVQVVREREVIYIEPARRQVIYLPYYDPRVVYGRWHWRDYPPVVWNYGISPRRGVSVSLHWSPAYRVAPAFFFSSFHWPHRQVVVVHHHHHHYRPRHYQRPRAIVHEHFYRGRDLAHHAAAKRWQHKPAHRRGVAYRTGLAERHRQAIQRSGVQRGVVRADAGPNSARTAASRSQQRQWAASRRSELASRSGANALSSRNKPRSGSAERQAGASRSTIRQTSSRSAGSSSERATTRSSRMQSIQTRPARSRTMTPGASRERLSSGRTADLQGKRRAERQPDRRSATRSVSRSSSLRSTSSSRSLRQSSPAKRSVAPTPSSRPSPARSTATERSPLRTRQTIATPPARPRAETGNRDAFRRATAPAPRSSAPARVAPDRSAARSSAAASRSGSVSRTSTRVKARRRD